METGQHENEEWSTLLYFFIVPVVISIAMAVALYQLVFN